MTQKSQERSKPIGSNFINPIYLKSDKIDIVRLNFVTYFRFQRYQRHSFEEGLMSS